VRLDLHERVRINLGFAMNVFLNIAVQDAQRLVATRVTFRERATVNHGRTLALVIDQTMQRLQTSAPHPDLTHDLKRINLHVWPVAYLALETAGVLAKRRICNVARDRDITVMDEGRLA
jgi:Na+/phosphate symporter